MLQQHRLLHGQQRIDALQVLAALFELMADAQELSVSPFCLAKVSGSDFLSVVLVQEVGQLTHFLQCTVCQLTGSGIGQ